MSQLCASRRILVEYLKSKTLEGDWHAVSDVANDLRVLDAQVAMQEAYIDD
jgi:hypothetical protein